MKTRTNTDLVHIPTLDGVLPDNTLAYENQEARNPFQGAFRFDDPLHNLWGWWQSDAAARIRARILRSNGPLVWGDLLLGSALQVLVDVCDLDTENMAPAEVLKTLTEFVEVAGTWAAVHAQVHDWREQEAQFSQLTHCMSMALFDLRPYSVMALAERVAPQQVQEERAQNIPRVVDLPSAAAAWTTIRGFTLPYLVEQELDNALQQVERSRETPLRLMDDRPFVDMVLEYGLGAWQAPVRERIMAFTDDGAVRARVLGEENASGAWRLQGDPYIIAQLEAEQCKQPQSLDNARCAATSLLVEALRTHHLDDPAE